MATLVFFGRAELFLKFEKLDRLDFYQAECALIFTLPIDKNKANSFSGTREIIRARLGSVPSFLI